MFLVKVIVFCFAILAQYKLAQSDCTVSINKFIDILPTNNEYQILYPKTGNIIETAFGNSIRLVCPSSQIVLKKDKQTKFKVEYTIFKCEKKNNQYKYVNKNQNLKNYAIDDLTCDELQPIEKEEPPEGFCPKNTKRVVIGFQIKDTDVFLPHIEVCWDDEKKTALYAKATIKSMPRVWKVQADRPFFRPGKLFDIDLEKYYTRHFQMYNLCMSIPEFITPDVVENSLLDKGHLVANADFPYDAQQRLTFEYINVAPQWGWFNQKNWRQVEEHIRNPKVKGTRDLVVYTGTYGNFKINDDDYYLYGPNLQIPVPKYFWKIVLKELRSNSYLGVAILGLNDISTTEDISKSHPCTNVLPKVKWLNLPDWDKVQSGYVIACEIKDFEKISEIIMPSLPVPSAKIRLLI